MPVRPRNRGAEAAPNDEQQVQDKKVHFLLLQELVHLRVALQLQAQGKRRGEGRYSRISKEELPRFVFWVEDGKLNLGKYSLIIISLESKCKYSPISSIYLAAP